jgi:hypothetical protein
MTDISTNLVRKQQRFGALRALFPIAAVLSVAGCAQLDSAVAPQRMVALALAGTNVVTRPWEGSCDGTGIIRADRVTLDITGTCNLSHLGRTTMVGVETLGAVLNAVHTFTAANGDLLHTTTTGYAVLKPDFSGVNFFNTETVTGGTGRFANATGTATRNGSTNFSDGSGTWEIAGTLTYAAADRR